MENGLIAVRVYPDGRELKAVSTVWESVFGIKDAVLAGDVFNRDGVTWFTPGNGSDEFTASVRAKMLDGFKEAGVDAEDWTDTTEWLPGDGYAKNEKALAAAGIKKVGDVVATKPGKDGKVSLVTLLAAKEEAAK